MDSFGSINIILAIISPLAVIATAIMAKVYLNKQHRSNMLLEVFKILNSEDHRKSRIEIYDLHAKYKENNDVGIFRNNRDVERVRADFDIIGLLVKSGKTDKDLFLHEFGPLTYRCWHILRDHVYQERQLRNFQPFMSNFQWLANESNKY